MKISQLLHELDSKNSLDPEFFDLDINGIADNSLDVEEGYVFVAIKGYSSDGHKYIEQAIEKGAAFIIGEMDLTMLSVPYLQVENSRKALGMIAKSFYGNPSKDKIIIGITGTNGKTTTSYMLQHLLESSGKTCSIIGTIQHIINGEIFNSSNTTPSSLVLHQLLSESRDEVVIIEVSSHGLSQYRIEGIELDYCLFTNLHHEHLDYHDSMDEYFQTKLLMFKQLKPQGKALINTDNIWGEKLKGILQSESRVVYTIGKSSGCHFRILQLDLENSIGVMEEQGEIRTIISSMDGIHNIYNTLMAYGTSRLFGIAAETLLHNTYRFRGVEGRFEVTKLADDTTIVIDYAHTPDAIAHCLKTAKLKGAKRIIHIFGFRGDRDVSKRKAMLSLSAELSDQYTLTFDDLNTVSANEMLDILMKINDDYGNFKGKILPDRTLAIQEAITECAAGDWIIITGKGHEKYRQSFELPTTSDRETVEYILHQLNKVIKDAP